MIGWAYWGHAVCNGEGFSLLSSSALSRLLSGSWKKDVELRGAGGK